MNRPEDQVLVIFGASGDLTKRMLMPSLYELHVRQMLPERFVILGTSRKSMRRVSFVYPFDVAGVERGEGIERGRGGSFLAESVLPTF